MEVEVAPRGPTGGRAAAEVEVATVDRPGPKLGEAAADDEAAADRALKVEV